MTNIRNKLEVVSHEEHRERVTQYVTSREVGDAAVFFELFSLIGSWDLLLLKINLLGLLGLLG